MEEKKRDMKQIKTPTNKCDMYTYVHPFIIEKKRTEKFV